MNHSAEKIDILHENSTTELVEDLNFFEIELATRESHLNILAMNQSNTPEIIKKVEIFQNQFFIQQSNIEKIKEKVYRLCLVTSDLRLSNDWINGKFYCNLKRELKTDIQTFNQLYIETEREYYSFLAKWI